MGACLSSNCWEFHQPGIEAINLPVQELILPSDSGIILESSDNPNQHVVVSPLLKDSNFAVISDSDDDSIDDEAVEQLLKEESQSDEEIIPEITLISSKDDKFEDVVSDDGLSASEDHLSSPKDEDIE